MSARAVLQRLGPGAALAAALAVMVAGAPPAHGQATAPTCTILDLDFTETDATALRVWNLQCSNPTQATGSATYRSVEGSAKDLLDYLPFGGAISVPPGLSSRPIALDVVGDDVPEPTDLFSIQFEDPTGVVRFRDSLDAADKAFSRITLEDDDGFTVTSISRTAPEGDEDSSVADVEITLNAAVDRPFGVSFYTGDITATAGEDYEQTNTTVTFEPGEVSKLAPVTILPDEVDEPDEVVFLGLGIEGTASLVSGGLTILDDDEPDGAGPCILLSDTAVSVSGPPSTPTDRGMAGPIQRLTMTNCGDTAVEIDARGSDATGATATWELTSQSSGGPIDSTCDLGLDLFRTVVTLWLPSGGGVGTSLAKTSSRLLGDDGLSPLVLDPAAEREISPDVEMPCEGSGGLDQPMTMNVVLTAVAP